MKLAIMQPYFLPYIGYFQLINAVDKFVIYDDVNYINKGWINRNNLLAGGKAQLFSIPLKEASQNKHIVDIAVANDASWRKKLLKSIQQSYQKAPFFKDTYPIIEDIINYEAENISDLNRKGIFEVNAYLGITTEIVIHSAVYNNGHLKAQDRILDICLQEKAHTYINPSGGMELYDRADFNAHNIELFFLKAGLPVYRQNSNEFVPGLSIIDVLMYNSVEDIHIMLNTYQLL